MTITSQPPSTGRFIQGELPKKPESGPTTPPPADNFERDKQIDDHNFSWLDLGKGVAGSVVGGAILGTGALAEGVMRSPRVTFEAIKGTWKSKMLGPILKSTLTPVILAAGLAAPVFTTLGGVGYGLFQGFVEGAEKNPVAAGAKALDTCKELRGKVSSRVVDAIREAATKEPNSPDEVYEISLIEAGKGLIGAAAAAAVDGVGIGGSVLLHTPQLYYKFNKHLWQDDIALPLKVGGTLLSTAAAGLATPFAAAGGALYGLGTGAYNGYQEGVLESLSKAGDTVREVNKGLNRAAKEDW